MEKIISSENSTFKKLKKLKNKKYREEFQLFLAEGRKFLDFDTTPEFIIFKEGIEKDFSEKIEKFKSGSRTIILEDKLFKELTAQETSQGVILVYKHKEDDLINLNKNIVILDRVADPGNLGTIIRLCDAAGFKDILLVKGSADIYNEKVVRSSMGSILSMNLIYLEEYTILDLVKKMNYQLLVTALDSTSIEYTSLKLKDKNAIVFGSEGSGVSNNFLQAANEKIIIPIYGSAESLNVGVASGIMLYKVREILEKTV
ncbi:MAG: TrmH family RNA methyltransferase [Fusobacteriaceae bacterium]